VGAEPKVSTEMKEIRSHKGFGEDIGNIVTGAHPGDSEFVVGNQITDRVILDAYVFDLRVPDIIVCQATGCWSSSIAASARTYSFHSSAQRWTLILNSQLVPMSCIQTSVTFSFTLLLAARIPVLSLYFILWQLHSHHVYIRGPAS
jgi:hypothetical protein